MIKNQKEFKRLEKKERESYLGNLDPERATQKFEELLGYTQEFSFALPRPFPMALKKLLMPKKQKRQT
jgi:hypothetical protein